MKKYKLTPEHKVQLKPWTDRWIANAMSTKPMDNADRAAMRVAIKGLYESAGLESPPDHRIVFVPSPFVLRFASGFAAATWYLKKNKKPATYAATDDATRAATDDATYDATDAATDDATRAATDDATDAATDAATYDATYASERKWFVFPIDEVVNLSFRLKLGKFGLMCASSIYWKCYQGGNQWSGWTAFLSFFKDVAKLPLDYSKYEHWEKSTIHGGPRIMHEKFCMICDRPEILLVDAQNRPHCDTGPFCKWRDGSALYSIHGVRVPKFVVETPDKITVEVIEKENNAEVRRIMIQRYPGGQAKWMMDTGAVLQHRDKRGKLWRKSRKDDTDMVILEVLNSTPEPDLSIKTYHLRVPPEMKTATEASAWLSYQTVKTYNPQIET